MADKKKKFKPVITRVKLNPEQAVLSCACYSVSASSVFFCFSLFDFHFVEYCSGKSTTGVFGYDIPNFGNTNS